MAVRPNALEAYFEGRGIAMLDLAPDQRAPESFGDAHAEHLATRQAAGLFDFSFMACVEVNGPESLDFLATIQTRALGQLAIGRIRYTLLLRSDGTVLNDATVWRTSDNGWLVFVGRRSDLDFISRHAASGDVRLDEHSGERAILALQGPRSRDILGRCLTSTPDLPYFGFEQSDFRGRRCLVGAIGYTGEAGYEIIIAAHAAVELWETLRKAGAADGLRECGFSAANTLRIEAGHILFANELATDVTPHELGLERLLDTKRVHEDPDRRLVGMLLDEKGPALRANPAAQVTSECLSPTLNRRIALGFVPWEARYPGTRVCAGAVGATVARLPFYDPPKRRPRMQR